MDLFAPLGSKLNGKKGQYLIMNEVARGGMGAIYQATDLEQVIANSMEIDPAQRYQTARQMRAAICPPRRFIILPF